MDTAPFRVNDAAHGHVTVVLRSRYSGKTGSIRQRLTLSTAVVRILIDTAPFRVNDAAVVRPCYGCLTVAVLR